MFEKQPSKQILTLSRVLAVLLPGFGYALSMARTVSLWDSGEFIASIHLLGIPHPPGAPFYMILGKFWETLLFFVPEIALRINLLSVFCAVVTCLLMFEIVLYVAQKINLSSLLQVPCALFSALLLAFSQTFWFNGGESEVYAFSMMSLFLGLWIVCQWDRQGGGKYSRWILLLTYLSFLGIGVHLYSMLWYPFLWVFIGYKTGRLYPQLWSKLILGVFGTSLFIGFVFYDAMSNAIILSVFGFLVAGLFWKAVANKEISDVPYWMMGFVLSLAIAFCKPFLFAVLLLTALLGIVIVYFNTSSRMTWVTAIFFVSLALVSFDFLRIYDHFVLGATDWVYVAILLIVFGLAGLVFIEWKKIKTPSASFYLTLGLLAILGYSTYLYVPIRSHLNPRIDEDNPDNWVRLEAFIERKQYGSENMLERMFHRRGAWSSQFGVSPHIGFLGYQASQFWPITRGSTVIKWRLLAGIGLFLFVLWGCFEMIHANREWMLGLLLLYGVSSVGLVLYMNFSDGSRVEIGYLKHWEKQVLPIHENFREEGVVTGKLPDPDRVYVYRKILQEQPGDSAKVWNYFDRDHYRNWMKLKQTAAQKKIILPPIPSPEHREVRNRDYFFTPAYALFCALLSLFLFHLLQKAMIRQPNWSRYIFAVGWVLALTSWALPYYSHWPTHNRSRDFFAADFAYNLLQSCPPHSLLFTNGDNDTFPLWYLQYVENIRTDVTVINFSLANTHWYSQQLTVHPPIVRLPTVEKQGGYPGPKWIQGRDTLFIKWIPDPSRNFILLGGDVLKPQDQLLMEAVHYNYPERPICFPFGTPPSSLLGLERYLEIQGLVQVLDQKAGINIGKCDTLVFETFRYRWFKEQMANPVSMNLAQNYKQVLYLGRKAHLHQLQLAKEERKEKRVQIEEHWVLKYDSLARELFEGLPVH